MITSFKKSPCEENATGPFSKMFHEIDTLGGISDYSSIQNPSRSSISFVCPLQFKPVRRLMLIFVVN